MKTAWILGQRIAVLLLAAAIIVGVTLLIGNLYGDEQPMPPERDMPTVSASAIGDSVFTPVTEEMSSDSSSVDVSPGPPEGVFEPRDDNGHGAVSLSTTMISVIMNGAKILAIVLVIVGLEWLFARRNTLMIGFSTQKPISSTRKG